MSNFIPYLFLAKGRASYRNLLRAANVAFIGDSRMLLAFRHKIRDEFTRGRLIRDRATYEEKIKLANECAAILRNNVVQATSTPENENLWMIQWRDGIEMGDNDSIKKAQRSGGKNEVHRQPNFFHMSDASNTSSPHQLDRMPPRNSTPPNSVNRNHPLTLKQLLEAHRERNVPQLYEGDIQESFVRGSGPGGQAINKTRSNVVLLHKPTGIRVMCQKTRSLETNRKVARRLLLERLDQVDNPGLSKEQVKWAKERERKRQRLKKARKKMRVGQKPYAGR